MYSSSYWEEYRKRDKTVMGDMLTAGRLHMVRRVLEHVPVVVDIGIGGGRFVEERGGLTFGYDVCPDAVAWLKEKNVYWNPYREPPRNITCWDSLEHLKNPTMLVDQVIDHVFVSMPIYKDEDDCLASKHYKPGEHIWYFTHWGLERWFQERDFTLLERNDFESECGREGIGSFVFRRR